MKLVRTDKERLWAEWMRRVIAGEPDAEAELVDRYKDGIAIIIGCIVRNEAVTEDLSQESFRLVLEKIRGGEVREPERLSGFICRIAENLAIAHVRRMRRALDQEEIGEIDDLRDPHPDPAEQLLRQERAAIARQVISELKIERDRQVLFRYYLAEEEKTDICADLGLDNKQFNSVLFRALKRYKALYVERYGEP